MHFLGEIDSFLQVWEREITSWWEKRTVNYFVLKGDGAGYSWNRGGWRHGGCFKMVEDNARNWISNHDDGNTFVFFQILFCRKLIIPLCRRKPS